jgi:acetoin:2,6-dichlorophenolindophenol oxidoreductase subunit alpha
VFFGDGASNQGSFHESLNLASLWKLPVIFVCENNQYGISVSQKRHQAITDIADRAIGYGMPGVKVDGMDVMAVYESMKKAIKYAKSGGGPTLIECKTYRFDGHHVGDPGQGLLYRTQKEMNEWKKSLPHYQYEAISSKAGNN